MSGSNPPDAAAGEPGLDFFISYTRVDVGWAEWIAWQLEDAGYRVLIQKWDSVTGSHWMVAMQEGMTRSERTIAVLSAAYLRSVYGQQEWQAAVQADPRGFARKLLPIRVEDCNRPGVLGQIVSTDLLGYRTGAEARQHLLDTIITALAGRAKPAIEPPFPLSPEPAFPGLTTRPLVPPPAPPPARTQQPAGGNDEYHDVDTDPAAGEDEPAAPEGKNLALRLAAWLRWPPRRPLVIPVVVVAVTALAVAAVVRVAISAGSGDPAGCATRPTAQVAEVNIAASADLSEELQRAASIYGRHLSHGQCVGVSVQEANSGTTMVALARGWKEGDGVKPDVWSPAGTAWQDLARERATARTRALFSAQPADSVVTSPLTIAMPEPMARALGWPNTTIGWKDLVAWAKHADGFWARQKKGKPQWGTFKLGKTNPNYSTSGLNATIAAFFAATGRTDELVATDIDDPDNQAFDGAIEQAAVHYGDTTLTFLANLRQADNATSAENPDAAMSYISAVTVEENAVVAYNAGYPCGAPSTTPGCQKTSPPHTKLVAFYPNDGILFSDHPYIELTGMSPAKKAVADDFLTYLHTAATVQDSFTAAGFRTYQGKLTSLITQANGALPNVPITPLPPPPADVLDQMLNVWPTLRKRANVLVLIDTSGSMNQTVHGTTKIKLLRQAEPTLLGGFTETDRVGLWRFSATDQPLVSLGPMNERLPGGTRRTVLSADIANLSPAGSTGLYNTIDAAVQSMRASYDPKAINAIVLLTDGRNETAGGLRLGDLRRDITAPGQPQIRIFSIAYGNEADQADQPCPAGNNISRDICGKTILQEISTDTGAREYDAKDATTINNVLANVISNF